MFSSMVQHMMRSMQTLPKIISDERQLFVQFECCGSFGSEVPLEAERV